MTLSELSEWLRLAASKVTVNGLEPMVGMGEKLHLAANVLMQEGRPIQEMNADFFLIAKYLEDRIGKRTDLTLALQRLHVDALRSRYLLSPND